MPKDKKENKQEQEEENIIQPELENVDSVEENVEVSVEEPEIPDEIAEVPDANEDKKVDIEANEADEVEQTVTVQPVKFTSFDDAGRTQGEINKNLDILMDIKLQLTVELGRTELPIKKVLELTRGSIIELEKVAGEPVELFANGKLVAHGEVVVIEDNFGLRITSITDPEDRLKGI